MVLKENKLAVVGSRSFTDYKYFCSYMNQILTFSRKQKKKLHLISGGADGTDSMAQRYAKDNGLSITIIYPDWNQYGKSAGFKRNFLIVDECESLIAFLKNESKGTRHSISMAEKEEKSVMIVEIED